MRERNLEPVLTTKEKDNNLSQAKLRSKLVKKVQPESTMKLTTSSVRSPLMFKNLNNDLNLSRAE